MKRLPLNPLVFDAEGVIRFRANAIVRWLLDSNRIDLNEIVLQEFPTADVEQFWAMLGYSVSGYVELSFIRDATKDLVEAKAAEMMKEPKMMNEP